MSEFTGNGFDKVPNLYTDANYTMHELATTPEKRLCELKNLYTTFLSGDPLPHHREQAERFLEHLDFEERFRAGEWTEATS